MKPESVIPRMRTRDGRQRPDAAGVRGVEMKTTADRLLDRLVRQERENMRLVSALGRPPQFGEVFELYRTSGFLYSAKSAALHPHMPAIERTYGKLLAPDSRIFRIVPRFGFVDSAVRLRNAISAFAYASGTWQGQHLVSRERHEFTGTLAVLIELVQGLHDQGARHIRLSFRPNNPGTKTLFGDVARRLPPHLRALSTVDYGTVPLSEFRLTATACAGVSVRPVTGDEANLAEDFYRGVLHPVELASLELSDPTLRDVGSAYEAVGLRRRRRVLLAIDHGEVYGACLVHDSSLGINFSFLENAVEQLRVRPDLTPAQRSQVWSALASAAVREAGSRGRDIILTLDPRDRDLSVPAGLIAAEPKQYAVLTVTREGDGYLRSIDCFIAYYRTLLAIESSQ